MEGEVMEAPEAPAEEVRVVLPAANFWELHRQLANCYVADISRLGGSARVPEMEVTEQLSRCSLQSSKSPRAVTEPTRGGAAAAALVPIAQQRRNSRRETIQKRRDKSLKTLRHMQLQGMEDDASSSTVALVPHECWGDSKSKVQPKWTRGRTKDLALTARSSVQPAGALGSGVDEVPERSCVLHPGGSFRTAWNLSMALCVLYDLMVIPLHAFDVPPSVVLDMFDWMIQIFWNLDLFISFITGYYDEGTLVFSLRKIAWHYAKTWFFFDVALLSMDWAFRIIEWSNPAGMESIMWSRSLRMLRFLRLMRMLRMVKLRRINEVFQEFFHSQTATLYYSLFSSLIHLCILNHLIACAWFAASHMSSENWVTVLGIENSSMEYQYLTCMNWAFAQLGVGSSPALATNVPEMAYCIVIAFRSLITSSTLISTVSNLMAGLSKIKEDENTEFRLLRAYMAQNHIEPQLAQKITQFLQYQYTLRQEARSADMEVPLLEMLSPQLQGELQFARSRRDLCKLQVLNELLETADRQVVHILHRVAQDAVKNLVVAAADVIFLAGNPAPSAFLKLSGELTYCNEDSDEGDETVTGEVWIAEVALWTPWHYLGDLVSADVSRVSSLDVEVFCHALSTSWQTQRAASRYAVTFLDKMISLNHWSDTFVLPREGGQARALPHRPEHGGHSWR
eukprot:Skav201814  [mRNA]  locus=scaffold1071:292659:294698:+ [translate_table: standard]